MESVRYSVMLNWKMLKRVEGVWQQIMEAMVSLSILTNVALISLSTNQFVLLSKLVVQETSLAESIVYRMATIFLVEHLMLLVQKGVESFVNRHTPSSAVKKELERQQYANELALIRLVTEKNK